MVCIVFFFHSVQASILFCSQYCLISVRESMGTPRRWAAAVSSRLVWELSVVGSWLGCSCAKAVLVFLIAAVVACSSCWSSPASLVIPADVRMLRTFLITLVRTGAQCGHRVRSWWYLSFAWWVCWQCAQVRVLGVPGTRCPPHPHLRCCLLHCLVGITMVLLCRCRPPFLSCCM